MEELNKQFGALQMHSVMKVRLGATGETQEIYIAQINNGTTDRVLAFALAPVSGKSSNIQPLSQINWKQLHVRSYASSTEVASVLKSIGVNVENLPKSQKLVSVNWGEDADRLLTAASATKSSKTYSADLPFQMTLHSTMKNVSRGNELEAKIEYIPALQTYNFTLVR